MEKELNEKIEKIANECYPNDEEKRNLLIKRLSGLVCSAMIYFRNELDTASKIYNLPEDVAK